MQAKHVIIGIVVFFSAAAAAALLSSFGAFTSLHEQPVVSRVLDEAYLLSNDASCSPGGSKGAFITDVIEGSFRYVDATTGAGEAIIVGTAISKEVQIFSDTITAVYLRLDTPQVTQDGSMFAEYFSELVERGNGINMEFSGALFFKLGELRDGVFSSTAEVSKRAMHVILTGLGTGEQISLRIQVPIFAGSDAPTDFSFACAISSEN